jgi:ADP-ribose pyrophosphatase YjhB (NUDIX family)
MAKRNQMARDEHGRWDIGGGMVEHGSAVEETLHKEIQEEYGASTITASFLGIRDVHRIVNDVPSQWIALDFMVQIDRTSVHNAEPHKFDAVEWFTLKTLPPTNELHSQLPFFLQKYSVDLSSVL